MGEVWLEFDLIDYIWEMIGWCGGLRVDWKRVDLYGKMGVSKIVREIEGIVGNEWDWVRGKLGERVDLSGDNGLVNWGVFGKWMGMWWVWGERGRMVEWWLIDVWFVKSLILYLQETTG